MDNFKRYFFVIFNILYVISGIVITFFSIWLMFGSPIFEIASEIQASKTFLYLAMGIGVLLAIIGVIGIIGTVYGKKLLLIIYVVIIVTIICGEVALISYITAKSLMGEELIFTDDLWDKIDSDSKKAIEERFGCCGYYNSSEYTEVPSWCYKNTSSLSDSPEIFQQGCHDALLNWLENNIYTVVAIAALVLVLEVCQIIVATLIIRHFNKVKSNPTILTPSSQELKPTSPPIRQSHIYSSEQSQLHNRSPDHLRGHSPISPRHYSRSPDHYFPNYSSHYDPHLHDYRPPMNYRRPSYNHRNYTNSAYRDDK